MICCLLTYKLTESHGKVMYNSTKCES